MEKKKISNLLLTSAVEQYNTVNEFIRSRFAGLYDDRGESKQETLNGHFYDVIREGQEQRFLQDHYIAIEYGYTYSQLMIMSIYQYNVLLEGYNRKIKEQNAMIKQNEGY